MGPSQGYCTGCQQELHIWAEHSYIWLNCAFYKWLSRDKAVNTSEHVSAPSLELRKNLSPQHSWTWRIHFIWCCEQIQMWVTLLALILTLHTLVLTVIGTQFPQSKAVCLMKSKSSCIGRLLAHEIKNLDGHSKQSKDDRNK